MQERAFADPKLEIVWNAEVAEINGDDRLESVTLRDTVTGDTRPLEVTGLFIAIGHDPRSELLGGQVDLDDDGYVLVRAPHDADQPPRRLRLRRPGRPHTTGRPSPPPAPAAPPRSTPSATSPPSTTRPPAPATPSTPPRSCARPCRPPAPDRLPRRTRHLGRRQRDRTAVTPGTTAKVRTQLVHRRAPISVIPWHPSPTLEAEVAMSLLARALCVAFLLTGLAGAPAAQAAPDDWRFLHGDGSLYDGDEPSSAASSATSGGGTLLPGRRAARRRRTAASGTGEDDCGRDPSGSTSRTAASPIPASSPTSASPGLAWRPTVRPSRPSVSGHPRGHRPPRSTGSRRRRAPTLVFSDAVRRGQPLRRHSLAPEVRRSGLHRSRGPRPRTAASTMDADHGHGGPGVACADAALRADGPREWTLVGGRLEPGRQAGRVELRELRRARIGSSRRRAAERAGWSPRRRSRPAAWSDGRQHAAFTGLTTAPATVYVRHSGSSRPRTVFEHRGGHRRVRRLAALRRPPARSAGRDAASDFVTRLQASAGSPPESSSRLPDPAPGRRAASCSVVSTSAPGPDRVAPGVDIVWRSPSRTAAPAVRRPPGGPVPRQATYFVRRVLARPTRSADPRDTAVFPG